MSAEAEQPAQEQKAPDRIPLAGEAFRTEILGHDVAVAARDRRNTSSWNAGVQYLPELQERDAAIALLYFWRHPDESRLLRAQISVFYNDLFYSNKPKQDSNWEYVLTFENYTLPGKQAELVDGRTVDAEELRWGYIRPGFGLGWREQVWPGHQDNMRALDLLLEPAYRYFRRGPDTSPDFRVPHDTGDVRLHLQARWDALERNLLELPQRGFACGADAAYGRRTHWEDWGINGSERAQSGREYSVLTAYALAAGSLPGAASERHILIGALHVGIGQDLDRFSAPRIGGGPDPQGEEYGSTAGPVLPGAGMLEFFPRHYAIVTAEYRWAPLVFTYLGFDAAAAWLDRLRTTPVGTAWENNILTAVGLKVMTGFLFRTRLEAAYHHNFSVVRRGNKGGDEIVVNLSKTF